MQELLLGDCRAIILERVDDEPDGCNTGIVVTTVSYTKLVEPS